MINIPVGMETMRRLLILLLALSAGLVLPWPAAADHWARLDRPWTNAEVDQAMAFCRLQPRVDPSVRLFVDMVMGRSIDRCMYRLGWVGVAR